jgi:hypothetical protein
MSLDRRHRRALAVGAGVLLLAVVVIALDVSSPSGRTRDASFSPVPAVTQSPASNGRVRLLARRDPFSPPPELATASPRVAGPSDTRTDNAAPESSTPSPPSTAPPPSTPPAQPSCGGAPILRCRVVGGHVVRVARIAKLNHEPVADLVVDARPYSGLRPGERFAHGFRLVGFNADACARIVVRDAGVTLCDRP